MMIHLDEMLSDKAIITPASNVFLSINIKVWGKNFSKILGVAGFKIEITVICVLNVTLRLIKKTTLVLLEGLSNSQLRCFSRTF